MIFKASLHTRMAKVKTFFDENMMTATADMDIIETKWQHALQAGSLPGQAHTPLEVFKKTMKADAGFCVGIETKLKVMDNL